MKKKFLVAGLSVAALLVGAPGVLANGNGDGLGNCADGQGCVRLQVIQNECGQEGFHDYLGADFNLGNDVSGRANYGEDTIGPGVDGGYVSSTHTDDCLTPADHTGN